MTQRHDQLSSTTVSITTTATPIQKTETIFPSAFDQTEIQNTLTTNRTKIRTTDAYPQSEQDSYVNQENQAFK